MKSDKQQKRVNTMSVIREDVRCYLNIYLCYAMKQTKQTYDQLNFMNLDRLSKVDKIEFFLIMKCLEFVFICLLSPCSI
jgi:hypothetical protein